MSDIAEQYAWHRPLGPVAEEIAEAVDAVRRPVQRDQVVYDMRGETWFFKGVSRKAYGNSTGRVAVSRTCPDAYTTSNGQQDCPHPWHRNGMVTDEFYPSVFGLYLGDAAGNEA